MNSSQSFKVYPTSVFISEAKKLKKKYPNIGDDFKELSKILKKDPITGNDHIGSECYKVRMRISDKGNGESGGARIIINVMVKDKCVYLLSVYDKGSKETISDKELKRLLEKKLNPISRNQKK